MNRRHGVTTIARLRKEHVWYGMHFIPPIFYSLLDSSAKKIKIHTTHPSVPSASTPYFSGQDPLIAVADAKEMP